MKEWSADPNVGEAVISAVIKTMPYLIVIVPKLSEVDDGIQCDSFHLYTKGLPVDDTTKFLIQYLRLMAAQMEANQDGGKDASQTTDPS